MNASLLMVGLFLVSSPAFAAKVDDAMLASFMKQSPESVTWAQKHCGDTQNAEAALSALSACAKERLTKLRADMEKVREQDAAEEANAYVPHESWNRVDEQNSDQDRDDEEESESSSSEF